MARTKKENGSSRVSTAIRGFSADFGPEHDVHAPPDLEKPAIITTSLSKQPGTAPEILRAFGGRTGYETAIHELPGRLYAAA